MFCSVRTQEVLPLPLSCQVAHTKNITQIKTRHNEYEMTRSSVIALFLIYKQTHASVLLFKIHICYAKTFFNLKIKKCNFKKAFPLNKIKDKIILHRWF